MKVKSILLIFSVFFFLIPSSNLTAQKKVHLNDFGKPQSLVVGNGYLYVVENTTVFIYDLQNFKLLKTFGKDGNGPGEIKKNPFGGPITLTPHRNHCYLSSEGKLSIFDKMGNYIKEYKCDPSANYYPAGLNYICMRPALSPKGKSVMSLFLADKKLKQGKMLYQSDFVLGDDLQMVFPINPFFPSNSKEKIFILAGKEGFAIDVFDMKGKKLSRISRSLIGPKVNNNYKKKTHDWFKNSPVFKTIYPNIKNRISFQDNFPSLNNLIISNNLLYVFTNKIKQNLRECLIMNFKGKIKKTVYLPVPHPIGWDFANLYTISNKHFYSLTENIEDENWILSVIKI